MAPESDGPRIRWNETMNFRRLLGLIAGILPASLIAVIAFLAIYSWPAVRFNGWGFVVRNTWNLGNTYGSPILRDGVPMLPGAQYGILFLIAGTLLSTLIALLLAVPTGVGAAIFLAEAVPGRLRLWLSFLVELLAAVPSVVFGLWGYAVLIPLLGQHVFPVMIAPLIAAPLRDAILAEPMVVREAAASVGAT